MEEKVMCAKTENTKGVKNYIIENQQITIDILMMAQEINHLIFGQVVEEPKSGNIDCALSALKFENEELKEIANLLVNIRNTFIDR